jgi:hypothetical protein
MKFRFPPRPDDEEESSESGTPATFPAPDPETDLIIRAGFRRAMRFIAITGVAGAAILAVAANWRTGLLFLIGAAISITGIHEWRSVTDAVFDRFRATAHPRPALRTFVMFFLRLGVAAAVLYASLRYLQGNVYALLAGLGLAIIALSMEAIRLLRR